MPPSIANMRLDHAGHTLDEIKRLLGLDPPAAVMQRVVLRRIPVAQAGTSTVRRSTHHRIALADQLRVDFSIPGSRRDQDRATRHLYGVPGARGSLPAPRPTFRGKRVTYFEAVDTHARDDRSTQQPSLCPCTYGRTHVQERADHADAPRG